MGRALGFHMALYTNYSQQGNTVATLNPTEHNMHNRDGLVHPLPMLTVFGDMMPSEQRQLAHRIQVIKFKYKGFHRNLQEHHVYDVFENSEQRKIPTGWLISHLFVLFLYLQLT